jgi:hypothetical protein
VSTSPFSVIYPLIANHAKRVPQPLMNTAILDAARQFCALSKFRQESVPVSIAVNTTWYPLAPTNPQEEVIGVEAVQYNGYTYPCPLNPSTPETDSGMWPQVRPYRFYFEPPNNLIVQPSPQQPLASGLSVRLILQPANNATTLDYSIVQQYDHYIADGALDFLMSTNDSPWTNPRLADSFRAKFEAGIAYAKTNRQTSFRPRNWLTAVPRY